MDLDPPEAVLGESRVGPRVGEPGFRTRRYRLDSRRVSSDQPTRGGWTCGVPGSSLKIPVDGPEILIPSGCCDPDGQATSGRPGPLRPGRSGGDRPLPFVIGEHLARFPLHRLGIVKSAGGDVGQARIKRLGHVPGNGRAGLAVHALKPLMRPHVGQAGYHVRAGKYAPDYFRAA